MMVKMGMIFEKVRKATLWIKLRDFAFRDYDAECARMEREIAAANQRDVYARMGWVTTREELDRLSREAEKAVKRL